MANGKKKMLRASEGLSYAHGMERESERFKKLLPTVVPRPAGHVKAEFEQDPFVSIEPQEIIRFIPLEELREHEGGYYEDMADLAVIFNHDVVEVPSGPDPRRGRTWRWRPNAFIDWIHDYAGVYTPAGPESTAKGEHSYGRHVREHRASLNLNTLVHDLYCGAFSMEEWMKFYMQIGYSLCGYAEVFGQHEASEFGLPGARKRTDEDDEDHYVQTVLEYMREKHKGKVLKL